MRLIASLALTVTAVALGGCHALREESCFDKQPYQSARSVPPLHAAEGLPPASTKNALKIPDTVAEAKVRGAKDGCLDRPPRFYADRPKTPAAPARGAAPAVPEAPAPAPAPASAPTPDTPPPAGPDAAPPAPPTPH